MHRLKLAGLPAFEALAWEEPPVPNAQHVVRHGGKRAWSVPGDGVFVDGQRVMAQAAGTRVMELQGNPDVVTALVARVDRLPPRVAQVTLWQAGKLLEVPGQAVGVGGGVAVVVDLTARVMRVVSQGNVRDVATLDAGMDPLNPPVVSVSPDGKSALCMDARTERSDASLEHVDLTAGTKTRLLGPLSTAGWVTGAVSPSGRMAGCVMRLGETPRFSVVELKIGKEPRALFEVPGLQPCGAPVFVTTDVVALWCCLTPNLLTFTGDPQVVLVHLDGGAAVPIANTEGFTGRLTVDGNTLYLEGGPRLGVLRMKPA